MAGGSVGWFGDVALTRWRLSVRPGRVLDRLERAAVREGMEIAVRKQGFQLWVRSFTGTSRSNLGPTFDARTSADEEGSILEFGTGTFATAIPWLMPTVFLAVIVGPLLGFAAYYGIQGGSFGPLLCPAYCAPLPLILWSLWVLLLGKVRRGRARRQLEFLSSTLEDVRILEAEPLEGWASAPRPRVWLRRALVGIVPLAAVAALTVLACAVMEYRHQRQLENARAVEATVRSVKPADLVRVRFTPGTAPREVFREPFVLENPASVAAVCEALGGGGPIDLTDERIVWSYQMTLEWSDGGTTICVISKSRDRALLVVYEHRGTVYGGQYYQLGPEGNRLLDPKALAR